MASTGGEPGVDTEDEHQDGDTDTAPDAECDTARLRTHDDRPDDHQGFDREQQPVHVAPRSCLSVPGRIRVTARLDRILDDGGGVRGSLEVVLDERTPGREVGIVGNRRQRQEQVVDRGVERSRSPARSDRRRPAAGGGHRPRHSQRCHWPASASRLAGSIACTVGPRIEELGEGGAQRGVLLITAGRTARSRRRRAENSIDEPAPILGRRPLNCATPSSCHAHRQRVAHASRAHGPGRAFAPGARSAERAPGASIPSDVWGG